MSQSRHCAMFKATDGKWYLVLGRYEYHYDEERDPFERFGPFADQEGADQELRRHANPGALSIDESGTYAPPPPESLTRSYDRLPLSIRPNWMRR